MDQQSTSKNVLVRGSRAAMWGLLILPMLLACGPVEETLPAELLGTWTTEDPSYEGRFMQIFKDRIYFGTGQGDPSPNSIIAVSTDYQDNLAICTIDYQEPDGDEYRLLLRYHHSEDELQLANRRRVTWTRVKT